MGYIADLLSGRDMSISNVHEATVHHFKSRLSGQIRRDIRRFVTEDALFTCRRRDLVMERAIDFIRQYCVPQQTSFFFESIIVHSRVQNPM